MIHGNHPYADFIHKVQKPARYLGGEYNIKIKPPESVAVRICMAFPDIYDIGMSHLGTKILYGLLNKHPQIACERAFHPWVDMEAELRERHLPVVSLENAQPLREFDVIGFSLQYEMTFTNVLNLLDLNEIPLRAADRDESWPLIIAGGPVATHPEPLAPFIDAFLIGDAEKLLPESLLNYRQWADQGLSKREMLKNLAALGGWYCPALYARKECPRSGMLVIDADNSEGPVPVVRAHVPDINAYPFPDDAPVAAAEAIFDRMSIEIARGCTEGCRFCQAGMIYRPVRERDPDQIVETVVNAVKNGGYDEVALTSLSTADYSCISPLLKRVAKRLREENIGLGVSSLRAYGLEDDLFDEIAKYKTTGLTFAPEAGTQRMRDVVNKNVSDADFESTCHRIFARGWQRMKLYFMCGLPTEEDADVAGIIEMAAKARRIGQTYNPRRRVDITASVSTHVPKPHTPFQWAAMDSLDEIERKQIFLRQLSRNHRVELRTHPHKISFLEGIVARGDWRVGDLIESAWAKGCHFDGWDDQLRWEKWLEAIAESGLDPQLYLGTLPVDGRLPWDHIDVGLGDKFLEKEWKRATKSKLSPPCGKPLGAKVHHTNIADAQADMAKKLICYHCGVACDLTQMREERIAFLQKLGAYVRPADAPIAGQTAKPTADATDAEDTPVSDAPPPTETVATTPNTAESMTASTADVETVPRRTKRGFLLPPKRLDQGEGFRFRITFTKLGVVVLTSQLDLTRTIPRVFRRAQVPVKYSQGFNPLPLFSYGPALQLGVASLCEVMDVQLRLDLPPAELLEKLNAVADPGLRFTEAGRIDKDAPAAARSAKLAEFIVSAPGIWSMAEMETATARAQMREPVMAAAVRRDGTKTIDITEGMIWISADIPTSSEAEWLCLPADAPMLRYRVNLNVAAHVRASDVAVGLLGMMPGEPPHGFVAARTGLWGMKKDTVFPVLTPETLCPLSDHIDLPRPLAGGVNFLAPARVAESAFASLNRQ